MAATELTPLAVLTSRTRFFYALGQAAEGIKNESFGIFLLFYYTNVLGLSGVLAGRAILIALVFDAVTDPLVGVLSDRTHSRYGRRHPYMLASALPLGLFFYGVFAPPADLAEGELFLWMLTFTVLTRGAMTLFHVPHLSLGAELSSNYEERTLIVTERTIWSRFGGAMPGLLGLLWFMRTTEQYPDGRFNGPWSRQHNVASSLVVVPFLILLPFVFVGSSKEVGPFVWPFLIFLLTSNLLHVIVHARERYRFPLEVVTSILLGIALINLWQLLMRRRRRSNA